MAGLKEILSWFEKNKYPTQEQFKESWTSFWHKSEKMPMEQVVGLQDELVDKALKSDLNAVETEIKQLDDTKASKSELASVVAGLRPMGSVLNLVELNKMPRYDNDAYFVDDQLSPEGDSYIYRWDSLKNTWINTKQVVFKDVVRAQDLAQISPYRLLDYSNIEFSILNSFIDLDGSVSSTPNPSAVTPFINVSNSAIDKIIYTGRTSTSCVVAYDSDFHKLYVLLNGGDFENQEVQIPSSNIAYIRASSRLTNHDNPPSSTPSVSVVKPVTNTFYKSRETSALLADIVTNIYNVHDNVYDNRINPISGQDETRNLWITTGYVRLKANTRYILKSSRCLQLRNKVFVYDRYKKFIKSIGPSGGSEKDFTVDSIVFKHEEDCYIRIYLYQGKEGGYKSVEDSLIIYRSFMDQLYVPESIYNPLTNKRNIRIVKETGLVESMNGWVMTDYILVNKNDSIIIHSNKGLKVRDFIFIYDIDKNYIGWTGSNILSNSLKEKVLFKREEDCYIRMYVYQGKEGGYKSVEDSLIIYNLNFKTINIGKQLIKMQNQLNSMLLEPNTNNIISLAKEFGFEPNDRHLINREWDYNTFITNTYDDLLSRHSDVVFKKSIGKSTIINGSQSFDIYLYEYRPKSYKTTGLIVANQHGGEREAAYSVYRALELILTDTTSKDIKYIRDNVRLLIVPSGNPYGYNQDVVNYNTAGWNWRRYQNNSRNTNLNRTWDYGWDNLATNSSGSDFVGIDRLSDESRVIYDNVILPNLNDIEFLFDCHTGTLDKRYWLVTTNDDANYNSVISMFNQLIDTKSVKKNYYAGELGHGATLRNFGFHILNIPSYTLENNSLPTSSSAMLNYTSESATNYVEYIINMLLVCARAEKIKDKNIGNVYQSHNLPSCASSLYGDMFNDDYNAIIKRYDKIANENPCITKRTVGNDSDGSPIYSYILDKTDNYIGDVVVVGGDKFCIEHREMYVANKNLNETEVRRMSLGTKHIYSMMYYMRDCSKTISINSLMDQAFLNYRIHFIPMLNVESFSRKDISSGISKPNYLDLLKSYFSGLNLNSIIYFDETSVPDRHVSVLSNVSVPESIGLLLERNDKIFGYEAVTGLDNTLTQLCPVYRIDYKSSLHKSSDFTTDQVTLYASIMGNIILDRTKGGSNPL